MSERWWTAYVQALVAAVLLAMPAILNRAPIFYEDTDAYLSRPATVLFQIDPASFNNHWVDREKLAKWSPKKAQPGSAQSPPEQWMSGRSPYWGTVAYSIVLLFGAWGIVALNALLAGTVLSLAWHRCFKGLPPLLLPPLALALAFLTPLGATVAFTMPDVLAGLLIAALGLLAACWSQLLRTDRVLLAVIAAFAVISHDSHLALAALLLPFGVLIAWLRRSGRKAFAGHAAVLAAPLIVGLIAGTIFSQVAQARTGAPLLRLPHLTAQVTSLEAGQRYVRERCDARAFAVCRYAERLPKHWIDFLFDKSPQTGVFGSASDAEKQRLSDEQYRFAFAVAREYPVTLAAGLTAQGLRQIATFDLADMSQRDKARFFAENYPPKVYDWIRRSRLWNSPEMLAALDWTSAATTILLSVAVVAMLLLHLTQVAPLPERVALFAAMVILGVLINALVCGVLASPLGRFQARVVWLVPFLGLALLALMAQRLTAFRTGERHVTDA